MGALGLAPEAGASPVALAQSPGEAGAGARAVARGKTPGPAQGALKLPRMKESRHPRMTKGREAGASPRERTPSLGVSQGARARGRIQSPDPSPDPGLASDLPVEGEAKRGLPRRPRRSPNLGPDPPPRRRTEKMTAPGPGRSPAQKRQRMEVEGLRSRTGRRRRIELS